MNQDEIKEKIKEAKEIVGNDTSNPYSQIAFREVLKVLLMTVANPLPAPATISGGVPDVASGLNIGEFMAKLKVNSEPERVVAILYFHMHNNLNESTSKEIYDVYSMIRQRKPANLSDVLGGCIRRGHIIVAPEKKDGQRAWRLTPTGEKFVVGEMLEK